MKRLNFVIVASLLAVLSGMAHRPLPAQDAAAPGAELEMLIKELKGEEKAKERTPAQLDAAYAKVIEALLPKMGSEDPAEAKQPQQDLQAICWRAGRPGAEAERAAVCKAIAARLAADTPNPAKAWLLLQLERVGRAEAVAAVTALLDDKDSIIRDCARRALEGNPAPQAAAALRAALEKAADPAWRAALLQALAYHTDKANADVFAKFAANDDDAVRSAAVRGLAALGDKASTDLIVAAMSKGSARARTVAADSYLVLADALCTNNDKASALAMYRKLLDGEAHLKCAALAGIANAGGISELPTLLQALADKDMKIRGSAMTSMQTMPGNDVTQALIAQVKGAAPDVGRAPDIKTLLLRVLANRGDKSVVPTLVEAAQDAAPDVRIAAYEGMGLLADESASRTLVSALVKTKEAEQLAAAAALARIPGEGVIDAIIKGLSEADPAGRIELVKTLAARKSDKVVPTLLKSAEDADVGVRVEALKALANLADEKELPVLVAILVKAKDKDQKEAEKAVAATCLRAGRERAGRERAGRERVEGEDQAKPVIAAFAGATPPVKCSLLRTLGMVGGQKALDQVFSCLKDENAEVSEAALRSLCDWPDAASAPALLELAKSSQDQKYRVLALRGYVRVVGLPCDRAPEETLKMLENGLSVAQRPEEKKLVIAGVAQLQDPGAFNLLRPLLADEALRAETVLALVKVAEPVSLQHRAQAEAELKAVADAYKDEAVQKQIKAAFERIAQYDDYVTAWMLSGPYSEGRKNEKKLFDTEFPPEQADAKNVKWQAVSGGADRSKAWKIEMDKMDNIKGNNRVAYLQAWVRSDKDQKARLEMGSDDGLKAWFNKEVVVSQNVNRSCSPGADKVEVALKKGWNTLLLKVTQGGSQWAACVRVRACPAAGAADGASPQGVLLMGDPKALDAAIADLKDESANAQAAEILPQIARATMTAWPAETKLALKGVILETKDAALKKQLAGVLGASATYDDCIAVWQVSGPYSETGMGASQLFDKAFAPELPSPDVGRAADAKWAPMPAGPKPGLIEMDRALGGSNCAGYLRTYVQAPRKQDALLEIGSDDGVKVWLNGQLIHANNVARPTKPGEDTVRATLQEGWNCLLMKITQGGGHWSACARFRDMNDKRIDGLKFQAEPPAGVNFPLQPEKAK